MDIKPDPNLVNIIQELKWWQGTGIGDLIALIIQFLKRRIK